MSRSSSCSRFELGDVSEDDEPAVDHVRAAADGRDVEVEVPLFTVLGDGYLRLDVHRVLEAVDEFGVLPEQFAAVHPDGAGLGDAEQAGGTGIDVGDPAVLVEGDDGVAHLLHHRLAGDGDEFEQAVAVEPVGEHSRGDEKADGRDVQFRVRGEVGEVDPVGDEGDEPADDEDARL